MRRSIDAHILLTEWAIWSAEAIIPKQLHDTSAKWQKEVPSDYPEESHARPCAFDDETMGNVDRALTSLRNTKPYVVILDTYRNRKRYHPEVVEEAINAFTLAYWSA